MLNTNHSESSLGGILSGQFNAKRTINKITHKSIPSIKKFLVCGNGAVSGKGATKNGEDINDWEPYETMESIKIGEIDEYLDAILSKYNRGSQGNSVNFMESPKSCRT